jgi:peptidoglycan/LPS O-acetylase OafA/YrhL
MLYFGNYLGPKSLFVAVLLPVILFAAFSWKFVESPALKLKNKRFSYRNFGSMPNFTLKYK